MEKDERSKFWNEYADKLEAEKLNSNGSGGDKDPELSVSARKALLVIVVIHGLAIMAISIDAWLTHEPDADDLLDSMKANPELLRDPKVINYLAEQLKGEIVFEAQKPDAAEVSEVEVIEGDKRVPANEAAK